MLRIFGGSAEALKEKLICLASEHSRMLVIVPEQYTLQTERDLMEGLSSPGFFDLEVLSPSRLTERVFSLTGTDGRVRIDARGKQFALARTLLQCRKELRYYESAAEKQGFMERIGSLIADLKKADVSPGELRSYTEGLPEGAGKDKLHDLALIYEAYRAKLADQFVDGEDVLESMVQRISVSGIADGAWVAVYGFDVFTGQMNRMLTALAASCEEAYALIVSGKEMDFASVTQSAERLKTEAEDRGIACAFSSLTDPPSRQKPEIRHLRQQYLSSPGVPYSGVSEAIRLYAAPNPYFEAHFVAQEMLHLHEKGVAFGEMAVLMGDANFSGVLCTVLSSYQIPAYVSRKLSAVSHGAVRFLLASLRAVAGGYRQEDMLPLIKSGYAPVSEENGWKLENYLLSYGIRGKLWLSPFERGSKETCAELEDARFCLMTPLETLRLAIRSAETAEETLKSVCQYLTDTGVFEKLNENREKLLAENLPAEAVQSNQVWNALIQLFNQAHVLLKDEKVTPRQLSSWLEAGLQACELSSLPPAADAVMCGAVGSIPLNAPRVLFFTNFTDGMMSSGAAGLLSEEEQEDVQKKLNAYLSLSRDGRDSLGRLDIWKGLSAPVEKLYITRSQAMQDGTALRPFSSLSHIRRLFPALVEEGGINQQNPVSLPLAPGPALDAMGAVIRAGGMKGDWLEAWKYLCQSDDTKYQAHSLRSAFLPEEDPLPLKREITHSLFMERIMSVSRLESFAVCPYKHFVDQGLSPQPRKEWKLTPIDAGNFYHSALEGFTRLLPTVPAWPRIDKKTCDAIIDSAAQPLFDQMLSGVMSDSARMRSLGEKYRRVLRRVAWTFTKGARQCAFSPACAEVRFGYAGGIPPIELKLKDGSVVYVRGVIDRIDRYAGDEGVFLRVVDYKSGNEKLSPARLFWGAQLQLLLYLQAALSMEDSALPAGAFYMHVDDPLLPDAEEKEEIEDALARMLSLKGVALKDAEILKKMDSASPPLTLPKVLTADGGFDKRALLATLDDMKALIGHAEEMACRFAEEMRSGKIKASPLCDKNGSGPCDYCDYAALCRKSVSRAPENARTMQEMKFGELLENINKNSTGFFS